jgi:hypothetical protein
VESIDEGWTRWLLEQYGFPFKNITDGDVRAGRLRAQYDAIVLPSATAERLTTGHRSGIVPPEYTGGLGAEGIKALKEFVAAGGTLVCLDASTDLAIEAFELPLREVARKAGNDKFFCPGSILRVELEPSNPLSYGMQQQTAGFFANSAAYEEVAPGPAPGAGHTGAPSVRTVARYGTQDLLLSGWIEGGPTIAGRPAVVEATVGAGRVVLIGFRAQHRGQSHATFRLLFNAILTSR